MKLQLALDMVDLNEALYCIEETKNSIDIIEVGTPLALKSGARAISSIKDKYPGVDLLADFKIMDAGNYEANIAFDAGADIVTVLGVASDVTIAGAISAARKYQKKIMVDLIRVSEIKQRIISMDKLGADYACLHTGVDSQNGLNSPVGQLLIARQSVTSTRLAIAGGINCRNIGNIVIANPDVIIVGAGITSELDRTRAAADIKRSMREVNSI